MQVEENVASPCVGICALNDEDECVACGRHCLEIGDWGVMDNQQKLAVLKRIADKSGAAQE